MAEINKEEIWKHINWEEYCEVFGVVECSKNDATIFKDKKWYTETRIVDDYHPTRPVEN